MNPRARPTTRFRVVSALAALAVAASGLLAASPANAHDALVSSDPAADATVDVLPEKLTLAFSAELLSGGGNDVVVTDAEGTALDDGDAVVDGTQLVQALLPEAAPGAVTVVWRAVSSDGHPIAGEYVFTVAAPSPTSSDEPAPEPTATRTAPVETVTANPAPASGTGASDPLPWVLGALAILVLAAIVVALLVARARRSDDIDGPDSEAGPGR